MPKSITGAFLTAAGKPTATVPAQSVTLFVLPK
jgi:hypothetical protein